MFDQFLSNSHVAVNSLRFLAVENFDLGGRIDVFNSRER